MMPLPSCKTASSVMTSHGPPSSMACSKGLRSRDAFLLICGHRA